MEHGLEIGVGVLRWICARLLPATRSIVQGKSGEGRKTPKGNREETEGP